MALRLAILVVFMFQSTLPRGERRIDIIADPYTKKFQSTLPRGERRIEREIETKLFSFNPRSHAESDPYFSKACSIVSVFQSTLPRGERLGRLRYVSDALAVSIHAPTRRATPVS